MAIEYPFAAIPEPYRILGLRLKPFCLGHYFLMARFGVAFVSDDSVDAGIADLVLGVLICSKSCDEFVAFADSEDFVEEVGKWGKQCGLIDFPAKVKLFNEYLAAAMKQPVVIFEGDAGESGAHWSQALKCSLVRMGYSEAEVMRMPLPQAFADFYKEAESNGVVTIASPAMAALMTDDDEAEPQPNGPEDFGFGFKPNDLAEAPQSFPFVPPPEIFPQPSTLNFRPLK